MITGPDDSNRIDRICAGLSIAAIVHCVQAPWLAPWVPWLAGETAHGIVAWTLILLSIVAVLKAGVQDHWLIRSICAPQARNFSSSRS